MPTYTYTVYTSILGCSLPVTTACEVSCWAPKTERVLLVTGWGSILTHSKYLLYMGYIGQHPEVSGELPLGPQVGLGLVLSADAKTEGLAARCFPHPRVDPCHWASCFTGK